MLLMDPAKIVCGTCKCVDMDVSRRFARPGYVCFLIDASVQIRSDLFQGEVALFYFISGFRFGMEVASCSNGVQCTRFTSQYCYYDYTSSSTILVTRLSC